MNIVHQIFCSRETNTPPTKNRSLSHLSIARQGPPLFVYITMASAHHLNHHLIITVELILLPCIYDSPSPTIFLHLQLNPSFYLLPRQSINSVALAYHILMQQTPQKSPSNIYIAQPIVICWIAVLNEIQRLKKKHFCEKNNSIHSITCWVWLKNDGGETENCSRDSTLPLHFMAVEVPNKRQRLQTNHRTFSFFIQFYWMLILREVIDTNIIHWIQCWDPMSLSIISEV